MAFHNFSWLHIDSLRMGNLPYFGIPQENGIFSQSHITSDQSNLFGPDYGIGIAVDWCPSACLHLWPQIVCAALLRASGGGMCLWGKLECWTTER